MRDTVSWRASAPSIVNVELVYHLARSNFPPNKPSAVLTTEEERGSSECRKSGRRGQRSLRKGMKTLKQCAVFHIPFLLTWRRILAQSRFMRRILIIQLEHWRPQCFLITYVAVGARRLCEEDARRRERISRGQAKDRVSVADHAYKSCSLAIYLRAVL